MIRRARVAVVLALVAGACGSSRPSSTAHDRWVYQADATHTIVAIVRGDGTEKSSPTDGVQGGDQTNPDWSPDGRRIVFVLADGETDDLWTVGADGTDARRLLPCEGACVFLDDPAWSPDGTQVMYERLEMTGSRRVATLESVDVRTGKVTRWLTAGPKQFFAGVRYSPDGRQVVFERGDTQGTALDSPITGVSLCILDLGDSTRTVRSITDADRFAATADWGPYGDRIVYAARPDPAKEATDLFTIRPDGTDLTRITTLTDDGGSAAEPAWATDGATIWFSGEIGGDRGVLAKVAVAGGAVTPAFGTEYKAHGRHPRAHAG